MSCDSKCSVALPRGAVGCSTVCDCGVSASYSLAFLHWHCDEMTLYHLQTNTQSHTTKITIKVKQLATS